MNSEKDYLRNKFIEFQRSVSELSHEISERDHLISEKEKIYYTDLFEILDAFENIFDNIDSEKDKFDKKTLKLSRNFRSIYNKVSRIVKSAGIVEIEFLENKAVMEHCRIIDTKSVPEKENKTILSIVKKGYISKNDQIVFRKAEVVTVNNT